ncbi:MAG TPA: arginase family protein [Anaerolineales bacterium]|nr:arginase family protein [Anaerolineales bacterium]
MNVQVILVPYDSGQRSIRMGSGPEHFINNGLAQALEANGHKVSVETIETPTEFRAEVQTQFQLYRSLAKKVAEAKQNSRFPLVLSGNCGATLGVIAGSGAKQPGVIWFDAHGEFNTPETTTSGFLDGMGLAIATGTCWKKLAASIPNFQPLPAEHILLVGGRDFDEGEKEGLEQAGASVVDAVTISQRGIRDALQSAITGLQSNVEEVHLHIDLDALNPKEVPSNGFVVEDSGLSLNEMSEAIQYVKESLKIRSLTIASFDPSYDHEGKALQASLNLIQQVIGDQS